MIPAELGRYVVRLTSGTTQDVVAWADDGRPMVLGQHGLQQPGRATGGWKVEDTNGTDQDRAYVGRRLLATLFGTLVALREDRTVVVRPGAVRPLLLSAAELEYILSLGDTE